MAEGPEKKAKKAGAKKASSAKKAAPAKKAAGAKKAGGAKKAATSAKRAGQPTHDEIARRAYEIHEREGGNHEQNWLRAERELRGQ